MARYIVTGLNLLDQVVVEGGEPSPLQLGGSPVYGLSGMLLWTKDIAFATRAGEDFMQSYGAYLLKNGLSTAGVLPVSPSTPRVVMRYDRKGNSLRGGPGEDNSFWRPLAEDIQPFLGGETRGVYISCPPLGCDRFWEGFFRLWPEREFSLMWEPNPPSTGPGFGPATRELCRRVEMASFNLSEGCSLFGAPGEGELLEELRGLGLELCLLRVGARGIYLISGGRVCFAPSAPLPQGQRVVDVTGCGNSSTAAAMAAFWESGGDLAMTGIMANISSSYVLRQRGPIPLVSDGMREEARRLAQRLYREGWCRYL